MTFDKYGKILKLGCQFCQHFAIFREHSPNCFSREASMKSEKTGIAKKGPYTYTQHFIRSPVNLALSLSQLSPFGPFPTAAISLLLPLSTLRRRYVERHLRVDEQ